MICNSRRNGRISRLLKRGDVLPGDADRAVGRLDQAQDGAADGGFSATGLADQAKRLAFADREADAIDRQHQIGRGEKPAPHRKMFLQRVDHEHRLRGRVGALRVDRGISHGRARWMRPGCQHAAQWPAAFSS